MPKTKVVDVGLLRREIPDVDIGETLRVWLSGSARVPRSKRDPADRRREDRARDLIEVLRAVGLEPPGHGAKQDEQEVLGEQQPTKARGEIPDEMRASEELLSRMSLDLAKWMLVVHFRLKNHRKDTPEWLAARWLQEFVRLQRGRQRLAAGPNDQRTLSAIVQHAEQLGRLEERMWWRCGIDPDTGKRREALALTGQRMSRIGKNNAERKEAQHRAIRDARFDFLRERIPVVGVDKASAEASAAGLGKTSAIKKQWNLAVAADEVPRLSKKKGTQP